MYARAIRAMHDPNLTRLMQGDVQRILENDQICYREDPESENTYKRQLAAVQKEYTDPVHAFLKSKFDVSLKIWHSIHIDPQDKSVLNMKEILEALDPIPLSSLYSISSISKSTALGLAMLYGEGDNRIELERAVNIARVDEHF